MQIRPAAFVDPAASTSVSGPKPAASADVSESQKAFRDFVGQTLFGQMLKSMRSTVGESAYFHGGQTEEIFQQQLDQVLVEEISDAAAPQVADPMFELFMQSRVQ